MEPDTVCVQVRNVHRAIATNAKLLGRDSLRAKDASLYRELVLHPAAALEDAVADSVLLHGRYGHLHEFAFMDPRFYGKQAKNVQLALDDNAQLQDMNDELEYVDEKPQPLKLSTMSDTFITELVESLSQIVRDNASVVTDQRVDTRPLKTSQPHYQVRLVSSLQNLLGAHIGLKSSTKVHEDSQYVTEGALETLKQENRRLAESTAKYKSALTAADKEKAQVKAQYDLQVRQAQVTKDALSTVQQENQRLAESAAQYKSALIAAEQEKAKAEADHNIQVKQARDTQAALTALQEENRRLAESTLQYKSALAAAEQDKAKARAEHANLQVRQARATEGALNAFEHENRRLVESTAQYKFALAAAEHEKAKTKAEHDLQLQARDEQLRLRMEQCRVAQTGRDRVTTENKKLVKTLEAYREHNRTKTLQAEELTSEGLRLKQSLNVVNVEYSKALALLEELQQMTATTADAISTDEIISAPVPSQHTVRCAQNGPIYISAPKRTSTGQTRADLRLEMAANDSILPPDRTSELSVFAEVAIPLSLTKDGPAVFNRESIHAALGGSKTGIFVRSTLSATPLTRKHGFQDFLCINAETHVWAPWGPGKHGFMFIILGKEDELFVAGQNRHIFVGKDKLFHYCGWYHVLRVKPLSKHAWASLPPGAKKALVETTLAKDKSGTLASYAQVLGAYNTGSLTVPCVRLTCREFDLTVYRELCEANVRFFEGDAGGANVKRRRTLGDEPSHEGTRVSAAASTVPSVPSAGLTTRSQSKGQATCPPPIATGSCRSIGGGGSLPLPPVGSPIPLQPREQSPLTVIDMTKTK